jgi:hypothetical protein
VRTRQQADQQLRQQTRSTAAIGCGTHEQSYLTFSCVGIARHCVCFVVSLSPSLCSRLISSNEHGSGRCGFRNVQWYFPCSSHSHVSFLMIARQAICHLRCLLQAIPLVWNNAAAALYPTRDSFSLQSLHTSPRQIGSAKKRQPSCASMLIAVCVWTAPRTQLYVLRYRHFTLLAARVGHD